MIYEGRFAGRAAVITGGASDIGLGGATAASGAQAPHASQWLRRGLP